jgi:hypothetical protein
VETLDLQQAIKKMNSILQCAFYGSRYFKWREIVESISDFEDQDPRYDNRLKGTWAM